MLSGKVVVITGGSRGIGRAIALACAREGMPIALCARSRSDLEETHAQIAREFRVPVLAASVDVEDPGAVSEFAARTEAELGPPHGMVCAAGILGSIGPFEESPFDEWERAIRVNLLGVAHCIRAVLPGMKRRRTGRIVLFSGGGQGPLPRRTAYAASKGAIWRLTESLGAELAPFGIYVNAIAPGAVNTRFLADLLQAGPERAGPAAHEEARKQQETGGASPDRAAELAVYLLSDASAGLQGKVVSALWDNYREWRDLEAISRTGRYTMKRVVTGDGRTRE
jgi:NAD(P)-dependent dehydrogenase (short-subunit alcohol dehydrogenase family)